MMQWCPAIFVTNVHKLFVPIDANFYAVNVILLYGMMQWREVNPPIFIKSLLELGIREIFELLVQFLCSILVRLDSNSVAISSGQFAYRNTILRACSLLEKHSCFGFHFE